MRGGVGLDNERKRDFVDFFFGGGLETAERAERRDKGVCAAVLR